MRFIAKFFPFLKMYNELINQEKNKCGGLRTKNMPLKNNNYVNTLFFSRHEKKNTF